MLPKVYLLGEPKAVIGKKDYRLQPNRRCQLLAYLAYKQERISRDQLADVFWSQGDSGAARRNLRKVLFEAKNLEWAQGFDHDEGGASWLIASDVAEFATAFKEKDWSKAVQTYGGSFLQGLGSDDGAEFDVWLEQERLRLEELYQEAAENHVETLERQGKIDEAVDFLKGLLARDALNETLHRNVMRLEFKRGNSEAALEQFERCRETLQIELGVEPLSETLELLKSIEQGGGTQAKRALLLKSANAVPNLPVNLVGREKLLQEALQRLQKGERVLLHGFGGMGKTALAATITKQFVSKEQTALWLQVGSDNPEVIFDAIAQPFDAGQDIAQAEDKSKALQTVLKKQSLSLLVLDDVWNAYTLSKIMEALPQGLPFLVTSRQRYPKVTKVYVDRLERKAALELLELYANILPAELEKEKRRKGEEERLEALCELLGDHPFALRLAGLALQENTTTAEQLYEQIKHNPHDFKMPGELREVGRESVASLLSVSLETLEDRAYETFLSYGLLESPVASAGFLAGCLERDVNIIEDALFSLVQRGLAERVSKPGSDLVSYRIHDLAHSYAKANRFQRAGTLVRSGLAFLKMNKDAVELLDIDISNLLAATQTAKEQGWENELIEFVYLLTVEGSYYMARGHNRRSVEFLSLAIDKAKKRAMLEKAHYLLSQLGSYYYDYVKNYNLAFKFFDEARILAQGFGNKRREAVLSGLVAYARFHQGKEDVDEYISRAYNIAITAKDDECLCTILDQLGYIAGLRGDTKTSNKFLYESLEALARLEKNKKIEKKAIDNNRFFLLLNIGEGEHQLGNFAKGVSLRHQALELARKCSNQVWMGYAHYELGDMYHQTNERNLARAHMNQALQLFEQNNALKDVDAVISFLRSGGYMTNDG